MDQTDQTDQTDQVDIYMPEMGARVKEVTLIKWHRQVGDEVFIDETLLEVSSDKVVAEVPSTVDGVITNLFFKAGDVLPVGALVAKVKILPALS
ncbi:MAG: hypothetical protein HQK53_11405 [Oligoflexia bacterium]|nr:hypothetical protein [Oligoflexia bacterium]